MNQQGSMAPARRQVTRAVEIRAPVNPHDSGGDHYVLSPGASTPQRGPEGTGGFYRAAPDDAIVLWLGDTPFGASPGTGVLNEKSIASMRMKYWLQELRAWPEGRWDVSEALLLARPAVDQLFGWINHWLENASVANGDLVLGEDLPATIYPRPPSGCDTGGQTSWWLVNADGGERLHAPTLRVYIRRDALLHYLTRCPWPAAGGWRRVQRDQVTKVLKDGNEDWPGVIEARPPEIGLLRGLNSRSRMRHLWSSAELLAWAEPGWHIDGGWEPAQTVSPPLQVLSAPCAPLRNLLALHIFLDLFNSKQARSSLTAVWLTSRARAQAAPAARETLRWCAVNGSAARILGQHAGAIYITVPEFLTPSLAQHLRSAQPLLIFPGSAWRAVETNDPTIEKKGRFARNNIDRCLKNRKLPDQAWLDLMSFGNTEQILKADRLADRLKPAYTAPAAAAPAQPSAGIPSSDWMTGTATSSPPPPPPRPDPPKPARA